MTKRPLPEVPAGKPFLSVRESAAFLGCSPSKIKKMRGKELPNQSEYTREQLLAAAKTRAEQPPKPRGKGLKLDLGNPVKKNTEGAAGQKPADASAARSPAAPATTNDPPKKKGGLLAALDIFGDDDDDEE